MNRYTGVQLPLIGIMPVIKDHSPFGLGIMPDMPVIEAQRASILVPTITGISGHVSEMP